MKRLSVLTFCVIAGTGLLLHGCQSAQDEAAKEKEKRFWKDGTAEKYKERQGKPEKPYWEK